MKNISQNITQNIPQNISQNDFLILRVMKPTVDQKSTKYLFTIIFYFNFNKGFKLEIQYLDSSLSNLQFRSQSIPMSHVCCMPNLASQPSSSTFELALRLGLELWTPGSQTIAATFASGSTGSVPTSPVPSGNI